jgi:flagella basal body P-ring formation protein FlgA
MEVAMYNRWPLGKKKTVQLMVILTILAWATQTLFHQWGYGAVISLSATTQPIEAADVTPSDEPQEKFVPAVAQAFGSTLELRSEATITGGEVKLKQVCRWADRDKATFAPIAELVLVRIGEGAPFRSITLDEIKSTLHDAGVNLATINFVGTTSCTIARGDVKYDEGTALQEWIDARQGKVATTQPSQTMIAVAPARSPKVESAAPVIPVSMTTAAPAHLEPLPTPEPATQKSLHTLREALVADASSRLGIAADTLQLDFQAQDEKALNLTEPTFKFQIDAMRVRDLGDVQWKVTLLSGTSSSKPMFIRAFARAWQNQIVIAKPLAYKAIIQESDVIERRTLADHLSDDPLVTKSQTVGQQAARDLKPGMIMTARMVDPVPLVKSGQYVTVTLSQGSVQIKTVAKAMEGGSFGQTIRVKNESTKDVFEVTLTGPQTATMNTPSTASEKEPAANLATARD